MTHDASEKQYVKIEKPASRVTALDAIDLDTEIQRILKEKLLKIFHTLSPALVKWEPELDTLLRITLWKLSLHKNGATFGQQLLSIKYDSEVTPRRATIWAALTIGTWYLKQRTSELSVLLVNPSCRELISQMVSWLEVALLAASIVNSLVFLGQGQFPTLADRLVGIRPVSMPVTGSRVLGYSFMTRELLWHGFIELIVFVLPLVNYKYIERRLRKCLGMNKPGRGGVESLVYTVATRCAICQEPPVLPHHMGCPHSFCYFCLQSNRIADTKFECPSCGHSTEDSTAVQPVASRLCKDL